MGYNSLWADFLERKSLNLNYGWISGGQFPTGTVHNEIIAETVVKHLNENPKYNI